MNWDSKRYSEATKRYAEYFAPTQEKVSVPKQIKRSFPALTAIILLLLFFSGSFSSVNSRFFTTQDPRFPRKIWQIWKVGALDFQIKDLEVARSWIQKNPTFRYEVLTDANDLAYVEKEFGPDGLNRLDIVHVYRTLTTRIIKADLLRYMVMYVEGGVYTDIDVEAIRPIKKFIPERYNERDVDMVVGVEIDEPEFRDHPVLGPKCESFVQWTFMCKPRLPVMMRLIETIIAWLKEVAEEQGVSIADIHLNFDQVISGTGPSAFTRAILADMSERTGRNIGWEHFHDMEESKMIGNILVQNVEAFAAGQGHSDAGNHDSRHALIRHHYHASHWPEAHPRFSHPMYGEVERCNWNAECVAKWDEDTAAWEKLPEEERNKQLALKEFGEREQREREERENAERWAREQAEQAEREARESAQRAAEQANVILKRGVEDFSGQQQPRDAQPQAWGRGGDKGWGHGGGNAWGGNNNGNSNGDNGWKDRHGWPQKPNRTESHGKPEPPRHSWGASTPPHSAGGGWGGRWLHKGGPQDEVLHG